MTRAIQFLFWTSLLGISFACGSPKSPTKDNTNPNPSSCSVDCNGAMPTRDCQTLNSDRYSGGTAACSDDCELDTSGCTLLDPYSYCEPNGATRCSGSRLEVCGNAGWLLVQDCAATGDTCEPSGTGFDCELGQSPACTQVGQTRCAGSVLQTCNGSEFVTTQNCADASQQCLAAGGGGYECRAGGGACTFEGQPNTGVTAAFFDEIAQSFNKAAIFFHVMTAENPAGNPVDELSLEVYPGQGGAPLIGADMPVTIDLSGPESSYATCGLCILGHRQLDTLDRDNAPKFMPISGTARIDSFPSEVGQALTITLSNVVMREVNITPNTFITTNVPGGNTWCVSDTTYTATAARFPCSTESEGNGSCHAGSQALICNGGNITPLNCEANQVCREAGNGTASCDSPLDPGACTFGFTAGTQSAYWDQDLWEYHTILATGTPNSYLLVENFPNDGGMTASGSLQLTGDNTIQAPCTTCVWALISQTKYMTRYGSIELTLPATPGDPLNATLNVEMHAVDENDFEIRGGPTLCLSGVTVGAATAPYPCFDPHDPGDFMCANGRLATCDNDDNFQLSEDCEANGTNCVDQGNGTASCMP